MFSLAVLRISARFQLTDAPSAVYTFDATNGVHTSVVNGTTYYIGMYGTYETFSASNISYVANNGNFGGAFYTLEESN